MAPAQGSDDRDILISLTFLFMISIIYEGKWGNTTCTYHMRHIIGMEGNQMITDGRDKYERKPYFTEYWRRFSLLYIYNEPEHEPGRGILAVVCLPAVPVHPAHDGCLLAREKGRRQKCWEIRRRPREAGFCGARSGSGCLRPAPLAPCSVSPGWPRYLAARPLWPGWSCPLLLEKNKNLAWSMFILAGIFPHAGAAHGADGQEGGVPYLAPYWRPHFLSLETGR